MRNTENSSQSPASPPRVAVSSPSVWWGRLGWPRWLPGVVGLVGLLALGAAMTRLISALSGVFQPIFIPLVISGALAYLIKPLVEWSERRGFRWIRNAELRQQVAVLTAMTVATLLFLLGIFIFAPSLISQLSLAAAKIPAAYQKISAIVGPFLERLQVRYPAQYEQVAAFLREHFQDGSALAAPFFKGAGTTLSNLLAVTASVLNLLLIPFFIYYILKDVHRVRARVIRLFPLRYQEKTDHLVTLIDSALSAFVRGQLTVCACMGILYTVAFSLLGVPSAIPLGFLSGFGHLVPYIGTACAALLTGALTIADDPSLLHFVLVMAVYPVVQTTEGFLLTPFILGERLDLHPFLVIVGLLVGHHLYGILGIILAVPTLAIGKVMLMAMNEAYERSIFYRFQPPEVVARNGAAPPGESPAEPVAVAAPVEVKS
jgi:predicted PurR-regulated permease PerM